MQEIRHGGALDAAIARHGGTRADWLDLSTGINPVGYPVPEIPAEAWARLPDQHLMDECLAAARSYYGVPDGAGILAAPGTQAVIQWLPVLFNYLDRASVVSPTYGEYEKVLSAAGVNVDTPDILPESANLLIIGQPNNPDGRLWPMDDILGADARMTIVDEAFADVAPGHSLVPRAGPPGLMVLRSFGKFFGLAGLRLGFAIGDPDVIESLRAMLGPWSVPGPALHLAARALADEAWVAETRARLARDRARLEMLLEGAGFRVVGGTDLFVLAGHPEAGAIAEKLAARRILVRPFDAHPVWLRFGLPGTEADFARLENGLAG